MISSRRTEALDVLVLSPVFKTGVGCEEHLGQVRFLCASAAARAWAETDATSSRRFELTSLTDDE
jgi:hypothetical protein